MGKTYIDDGGRLVYLGNDGYVHTVDNSHSANASCSNCSKRGTPLCKLKEMASELESWNWCDGHSFKSDYIRPTKGCRGRREALNAATLVAKERRKYKKRVVLKSL